MPLGLPLLACLTLCDAQHLEGEVQILWDGMRWYGVSSMWTVCA